MTGFGAASLEGGAVSVRAEIRSVNHRHLQVKVRLPSDLGHLEPEVEALVRRRLERGSVAANVGVQRRAGASAPVVDVAAARGYLDVLGELAGGLGIAREISLDTLVGLPGVLAAREDSSSRDREGELVIRAVGEALDALSKMRAAEGESLRADLEKNAAALAKVAARIAKRMPVVVREHHKSLVRRVDELLSNGRAGNAARALGPNDLAREIALLADRLDVSEELARFESHLDQWGKVLAKGGSVGRQLDFLVQELLREANTLGAKCSDARVAHAVVELKSLIERLREQVQNVE